MQHVRTINKLHSFTKSSESRRGLNAEPTALLCDTRQVSIHVYLLAVLLLLVSTNSNASPGRGSEYSRGTQRDPLRGMNPNFVTYHYEVVIKLLSMVNRDSGLVLA